MFSLALSRALDYSVNCSTENRKGAPGVYHMLVCFFFSSRRRHTRFDCDWSSDVCSSDLVPQAPEGATSYYARYIKDGKRYSQPLGKELAAAFITYKNLEMAREFRNRDLPVPPELTIEANQPSKLVADLAAKYLEEIKDGKARKTWQAYQNSVAFFLKSCKRHTAPEITREDLLAFKTFLRSQGLSERSIYNNFLNVMVFLKWAGVRAGVKKDDWPRKPEREPEEYSDEEIKTLLSAAENGERLVLHCFLCSALRSGELSHLTYGDIDFKHSVWTVR